MPFIICPVPQGKRGGRGRRSVYSLHVCVFTPYLFLFVEVSVPEVSCRDGDVRLVGGANSTIGRIEVCVNRAWGTVCDTRFGTNEALVICRQLGFSTEGECACIHLYNIHTHLNFIF